jgi:hypothetical protein
MRVTAQFLATAADVARVRTQLCLQAATVHRHTAPHSCCPFFSVRGTSARVQWQAVRDLEREMGVVVSVKPELK